jgi:hypothetical protein
MRWLVMILMVIDYAATVFNRYHLDEDSALYPKRRDLLNRLSPMVHGRPRVFLTHGEARGRESLATCIEQRFQIKSELPGYRDAMEL